MLGLQPQQYRKIPIQEHYLFPCAYCATPNHSSVFLSTRARTDWYTVLWNNQYASVQYYCLFIYKRENLYTYIRRSRIVLNIGYYSNTLLATYRLNEILIHQRVAFSEKSIHASEYNVIEEYKKAGVIFFSKITDTLHNIEIELVRPLAQLLYNKKQYDHLIQQGQQFVIAKEHESQNVLKKMDL